MRSGDDEVKNGDQEPRTGSVRVDRMDDLKEELLERICTHDAEALISRAHPDHSLGRKWLLWSFSLENDPGRHHEECGDKRDEYVHLTLPSGTFTDVMSVCRSIKLKPGWRVPTPRN
jgi:hypothetical protein